jgi:hypothetical protein
VPPPQLEVNVGMTQLRQPQVQSVKAYPDCIDIAFDKYMDPATLSAENIFVSYGGQQLAGTLNLLDAEGGYEQPERQWASRVRFAAAQQLPLNGKVQLTVKKDVESYAGLQMEEDFTQEFGVEQRIETLVADSLVNIGDSGQLDITVQAQPAEAARGRKVSVTSLASDVVTASASELTLDHDGTATVTLTAQGVGIGAVRLALADSDLQATTLVVVRDSALMTVADPEASRLSGTEVYRGAEIRLTCQTAGATILYTLDGTCPCDAQNAGVRTYTGPIVATGDSLVVRAIAVARGMAESDVAEFRYRVVDNVVGIETTRQEALSSNRPVAYYRLDGRRTQKPQRGLNIVRYANGQVRKVVF